MFIKDVLIVGREALKGLIVIVCDLPMDAYPTVDRTTVDRTTVDRTTVDNNATVLPAQSELFGLLRNFATEVILGQLSSLYRSKKFGPKFLTGDAYVHIILPVVEAYFNTCAWLITSREDSYINKTFDAMVALEPKYNPICLLQLSVMLVLHALKNIDIRDVVCVNGFSTLTAGRDPECTYKITMEAIRAHVLSIISQYHTSLGPLNGCSADHIHIPIERNDVIFTFTSDRFVDHPVHGKVKLTTI